MTTYFDLFTLEEIRDIIASSSSYNEIQQKLGYSGHGMEHEFIDRFCEEHNISLAHLTHENLKRITRTEENIFVENSTAAQATLRRWYKKGNYSEYKCAICGQEPMWNGVEIALTLDHINGNNKDDRLENLRWICPNCDRTLDTFTGRNKVRQSDRLQNTKKYYCEECGKEISKGARWCLACSGKQKWKTEHPDAETLKQLLLDNNGNFSAVSRLFEVTDNTVRKWCKKYNMPFHSSDYKKDGQSKQNIKQIPNYLAVVNTYQEEQNITTTAKKLNLDAGTVHDILIACGIEIKSSAEINKEKYGHKINMINPETDEIINGFQSFKEAARYLLENNLVTPQNENSLSINIGRVCKGERKIAAGYKWSLN